MSAHFRDSVRIRTRGLYKSLFISGRFDKVDKDWALEPDNSILPAALRVQREYFETIQSVCISDMDEIDGKRYKDDRHRINDDGTISYMFPSPEMIQEPPFYVT